MKDSLKGRTVKSSHEDVLTGNIELNVVSAGLANKSGHELGTAQPQLVTFVILIMILQSNFH